MRPQQSGIGSDKAHSILRGKINNFVDAGQVFPTFEDFEGGSERKNQPSASRREKVILFKRAEAEGLQGWIRG